MDQSEKSGDAARQTVEAARASVASADATAMALQTRSARTARDRREAVGTATALAQSLAEARTAIAESSPQSLDRERVEIVIEPVSGDPLLATDAARQEFMTRLRSRLSPYVAAGCRVGVALTFVHAEQVGVGQAQADDLNASIADEMPGLFDGAAFENFGYERPPYGQVTLQLYFFSGCAAES